jgi:ABC-type Fe3+/spermidine/putrescine transport system ATPase subunit
MNGLQVSDIHKTFGEKQALSDVSFDVAQGEVVAVLGPSGCGKSTLLSIIAGLVPADQGDILWNDTSLSKVPPHRREFGLMFQDFALFPHLNVFDNIAFGLRMTHMPANQVATRADEVLQLVGLNGFSLRDVNTLSGGESQRVALARSLAPYPRLLMLDEPLGSLDRMLRERLVLDLKEILTRSKQTAIYVTHDQEEAFTIADNVVVMNYSQVEQIGHPIDIYRQPASVFVAHFLGLNNLLPGEIHQTGEKRVVSTAIGKFPTNSMLSGQVTILIRPDSVHLENSNGCQIQGIVVQTTFRGNIYQIIIEANGVQLKFELPSTVGFPEIGRQICINFDPVQAIQIFSSDEVSFPHS